MTYEEREKRLCDNCEAKENCSYISRNLERKCTFQETTMYGWELGWQDAINKACEWLNENMEDKTRSYEDYDVHDVVASDYALKKEFIDACKKYMEEQGNN